MRHKITADLRYPGLWRGCVGAWAPLLGPTGTIVRDSSGRGKPIDTFAGVDPRTGWKLVDGVYCIDFDGTNDRLTSQFTGEGIVTTDLTMMSWYRPSVVTSGPEISRWANATNDRIFGLRDGGIVVSTNGTQNSNYEARKTTSIIANTWTCLAGTWSANVVAKQYLRGDFVVSALTPIASLHSNTAVVLSFGETQSGIADFTGQIAEFMIWNRVLSETEIKILARRPGIAYETTHRRSYKSAAAAAGTTNNLMLLGVG